MLNKKKIIFVIFSRANYNSIKSVILETKKNKKYFEYSVIVGASAIGKKFGNVVDLIRKDGIKVDHEINNIVEVRNWDQWSKQLLSEC